MSHGEDIRLRSPSVLADSSTPTEWIIHELAASFTGAQPALVARHLETLALMGELSLAPDGRYAASRRVA